MKEEKKEVYEIVRPWLKDEVSITDMSEDKLRELCVALRDHIEWLTDTFEVNDSDIATLETNNEQLEIKLEKAEAALNREKESKEFWENRSNEYEQKFENIKKDFSAIAQLMTTLISR